MKKKIFAVTLAALVLLSCCTVFASASAGETAVAVNYNISKNIGYCADSSGGLVSISAGNATLESSGSVGTLWKITLSSGVDTIFDNNSIDPAWIGFGFKITPTTDLSSYDLTKYDIRVTWAMTAFNTSADVWSSDVQSFLNSNGTLGLSSSSDVLYVPRVGTHNIYSLATINHETQGKLTQSVTFTDSNIMTELTSSSGFNICMPIYVNAAKYVTISFQLHLIPKTTQTGEYDLGTPASYTFGIPVTYGLGAQTVGQTITDTYGVHDVNSGLLTGYRFRDYSNYYNVASFPFLRDQFGAFLTVGRKDNISDASAWQNSVLDTIKFDVPYTLTLPADFDLDAQKVEFLFRIRIAGKESQLNWYTLNELCGSLYSQFYEFNPYALKVGEFTIGYKYFTTEYFVAQKTVELTLRLSTEDETQKMFIKALLANSSFNLTFSVAPDMHGAFVGLPYAGFFLGDASPSPDNPGGYSKSDLDAAFNRGYNSGLSDGSDKNYVFGFVNGTWTAFTDFYSTVTNGISIGGIRLSAIITSICIVALLVIVIKKVV